jgi:hypothetical protein
MQKPHLIMENNNDAEDNIPEVGDLPQVEAGKEDTTDWKAKALEAQETAKKLQGMAKRFKTKVDKLASPQPAAQPANNQPANQSKGFDYGQLAYLESKGITDAEDQKYLENLTKESGTELKDLLGKSWVQSELKERAGLRATAAATPSGTKRAGNQTNNDVDFWLQKGTLPPNTPENRELRTKVVNARLKAETSGNNFTSTPVVGGGK